MHRFVLSSLLSIALAGAVFAQPPTPQQLPTAPQMLSHRLQQMAVQALAASRQQIQPWQTTRALILLNHATQLDPDDAELWHLKAEALELAGRTDELVDALQAYIRLRPDDDVAQLQLVRLLADRQQTVDLRLAFFAKIYEGDNSRKFTKPLRSRVAYSAAMLQREQGRMDEYARLLSLALSLDPTNKRAAAESFHALVQDRKSSLVEQSAALFTLFNADPIDPSTHAAIADMLSALGHYEDSLGWYASAATLQNARGSAPGIALAHSWAMALWGAGETSAALQLLGQLDPPPPADDAQQTTPPDQPPTADTMPPTETLMLRSIILSTGGDSASPSFNDNFSRLLQRLAAAREQSPDSTDPLISLIWAHLLTGQQPESVAALIDQLIAMQPADSLLSLLRGWLAIRRNLPDEAQTLLTPLAADDPRALLGLAFAADQAGDRDQAVKLFQQIAQTSPNDVFGLIAVSSLHRMSLTPPHPPLAQSVAELFGNVPPVLRNMAAQPLQYLQLNATPLNFRHNIGQPILLTVELRNVCEFPLGLGPTATLAPRVFLLPKLTVNGQPMAPSPPIVIDMRRRLRLDPQQTLKVTVRVDSGHVRQVLDANPAAYIQIDLTAMLNPRLTPSGGVTTGLLGSSRPVRNIVRRNTPFSPQIVDQKLTELVSPDPAVSMAAISLLLPLAPVLPEDFSEVQQRIVSTTADAFPRLPQIVQAWVVSDANDPRPDAPQHFYQPILDQAAASPSPLVRITLLATKVDNVDSPFLLAALQSQAEDEVKQFAQATVENVQWLAKLKAEAEPEAAASPDQPATDPSAPSPSPGQ